MFQALAFLHKHYRVYTFLRRTQGRIFSVTFDKLDGSRRTLNCKILYKPTIIKSSYPVLENNILHKRLNINESIRSFRTSNVIKLKCGNDFVSFEKEEKAA